MADFNRIMEKIDEFLDSFEEYFMASIGVLAAAGMVIFLALIIVFATAEIVGGY